LPYYLCLPYNRGFNVKHYMGQTFMPKGVAQW
jgi:hypothetical protein